MTTLITDGFYDDHDIVEVHRVQGRLTSVALSPESIQALLYAGAIVWVREARLGLVRTHWYRSVEGGGDREAN